MNKYSQTCRCRHVLLTLIVFAFLLGFPINSIAHGVAEGDQGFIQNNSGRMLSVFLYLGAKHMVTGYDHLLFLVGVIFFLYRARDIGIYVTLFAIGHSLTMLIGVLANISINPFFIDAIIGFSVVYKAADNLGWLLRWFGRSPDTRVATLVFGLLHGFGLATKLQEFGIEGEGLVANLLAFNVGVEIGQLLALSLILIVMIFWQKSPGFWSQAKLANIILLLCGVALIALNINGFILSTTVISA